jgi:hypothetical protein
MWNEAVKNLRVVSTGIWRSVVWNKYNDVWEERTVSSRMLFTCLLATDLEMEAVSPFDTSINYCKTILFGPEDGGSNSLTHVDKLLQKYPTIWNPS